MSNLKSASPNCQTLTLPCGLRVVYRYQESPVSYCGFMMNCGTRNEIIPSRFGLAHFIEHILFKGTSHRDSWHINNRMESVGGELNAFTTKEETTFYSVFLNQHYERAIELLCDLVCNPTAPERELLKEQEVVIDEIMSYRDTPSELIFDEFENRLFAGHPLGHNILGSEDTVRTFHSEECLQFIQENYTPQNAIFFFQGKEDFERVVRKLEKWYRPAQQVGEDDKKTDSEPAPLAELDGDEGGIHAPFLLSEGHHQSHVLLGATTYPIGHPDAAALALINNILGGPGMNSRLNLSLRERRGLVYNVESNLTNYTDAGYFSIYFGCDHDDVRRCLRLCQQEIEHLGNTPLSLTQLTAAKRQLCGQHGVASANLENSAIMLAKNLLRLGRIETSEDTYQRINAVTPEQIMRIVNTLFGTDHLKAIIIQ